MKQISKSFANAKICYVVREDMCDWYDVSNEKLLELVYKTHKGSFKATSTHI